MWPPIAAMTPTPRADSEAPLSLGQQRLWFLDRFEGAHSANQSAWLFRWTGSWDAARFTAALKCVIEAHEVLRTVFPEHDGQPVARTSLETAECEIADLAHLPCAQAEAAMGEQARAFAQGRYDTARGPLYRARLFRLSNDSQAFAWGAHHLVFDEPSLAIFTRDLAAAHRGEFVPEKLQFRDFAERESRFLQSADFPAHLEFWKRELASPLPVLQMPADRPRPAVQTFAGAVLDLRLTEACADKLQSLCKTEACPIANTLLAAYAALLYRHGGQEDVAIGLPNPATEFSAPGSIIGPTTGTTVFRADLRGAPSFRALLQRTNAALERARAHRGAPVERIVEELKPERNLSYHPLFQTVFASTSGSSVALALDGAAPSAALPLDHATPFDLAMGVESSEEQPRITLRYNRDLFDASTMERLLGHYRTLLESVASDPEQAIDRIPILTDPERQELIANWNATAADDGAGTLLHHRFEQQAAQTPFAIAVVFGEETLTYAELNRQANQLAHRLRGLGVGAEMRVGISMHRSFEMLAAILGILKAGAGYVPLDPVMPPERLGYMISEAQLALILTQERFLGTLAPHGVKMLALDGSPEQPFTGEEENPPATPFSDSLVYITYTSGSTGQPKGILMTQRPLLNLLGWMLSSTHLPPQARTLQFASLSFDVSFQDIFSTWLSGGALVLITEAERQDLAGLPRLLDRHGVHRIFLPAVALQQLAEGYGSGDFGCRELRKVISGSEQLMITDAVRQMFTRLPDCRLHNEYGPSETHVVTELALEANPENWVKRPSVGRPISNTQIYILDRAGSPAPIGVPGELHIGGAGLARGYLGREALTAEKFIPDPFDRRPEARLYRTGDQARWLPDGTIEFIGRLDHQIKIRGYRIEPGDIEAALEKHPLIREACVIAHEFGPADKRLVAYLAADQAQAPGISEIRAFLAAKLPEYMIPASFITLDTLPLNANGKVDRKALPLPEATRPNLNAAYLAPESGTEKVIAALWREVLRLDKVGIRDNFFDLGGNSVMIVRIHHRLKQHLGRAFPLIALFQYPTIDTLAQYLDQNGERPFDNPQAGILDRAAKQREALARRRVEFASRPR